MQLQSSFEYSFLLIFLVCGFDIIVQYIVLLYMQLYK